MSQPVSRSDADRNLLFGILAVQINFIDRDALVSAMNAWVLDKQKPLGQVLLEQQKLTAEQLTALDALIEQHLKLHCDNPEASLRVVEAQSSAPTDLFSIQDDDVQASLAKLGAKPIVGETVTYHPPPREKTRYQKLRELPPGGQSLVFVANDTELNREVFLKEIKPGYADHADFRQRFVLEAEITGGLEHPGIVPVYGLGSYPNGRPFYAMRFIPGDNLKRAIDQFHLDEKTNLDVGERSLAFRQLLRRFVDVCNAVAYAHSRGVLHRDIKPANVMLGKFGETLVVDWGLAKTGTKDERSTSAGDDPEVERTLRPASGSSVEQTVDGSVIGTAHYMSPEQAAGRILELGPTSDIYSLGSTLYVLLTGEKPYSAPSDTEVMALVRRGQFTPPKQVKPSTPAALDAICRKAMSLQPKDRYATALELAADVEHWLADEPVAAYPEPWTARAGRWTRRHRTAVVSAGIFLVCAVIGLAISTALISSEQRRTEEQKRLAVENYKLSREQSFNIIDLIESSEAQIAAVPSLHKTRKDILVLVAKACRGYLEQEPDDAELRRKSAQVFRYAANVHRLTDEIDAAEPLYRDAIKLYDGLTNEFLQDTRFPQRLAETLRDQAKLQSNLGRLNESDETLERSIALIEKLIAEHPQQTHLRQTLAATLVALANLQYTRGRYDDSGKSAARAAEIYREFATLPADKRHSYDPVLLAAALNLVAMCERESGRLDAANEAHKEPMAGLRAIVTNVPADVNEFDVKNFYALCLLEQSRTWAKLPNPKAVENAEKGFGAAITTFEALAKKLPLVPMYRESLGVTHQYRGQLRANDPARHVEARDDLEKSRTLLEQRVQESPKVHAPRGDLGRTYLAIGRLAKSSNDPATADWFRKAAESLEKAVAMSPDHAEDKQSLVELSAEMAK